MRARATKWQAARSARSGLYFDQCPQPSSSRFSVSGPWIEAWLAEAARRELAPLWRIKGRGLVSMIAISVKSDASAREEQAGGGRHPRLSRCLLGLKALTNLFRNGS